MIDLKDTKVILTGATGGIGNSILENFSFILKLYFQKDFSPVI